MIFFIPWEMPIPVSVTAKALPERCWFKVFALFVPSADIRAYFRSTRTSFRELGTNWHSFLMTCFPPAHHQWFIAGNLRVNADLQPSLFFSAHMPGGGSSTKLVQFLKLHFIPVQ